jgi:hypothetical protein
MPQGSARPTLLWEFASGVQFRNREMVVGAVHEVVWATASVPFEVVSPTARMLRETNLCGGDKRSPEALLNG